MKRNRLFVVALATAMILSVAAPLGTVSAVAASNDAPADEIDELNVSVDDTVVTVTWNESAFETRQPRTGRSRMRLSM